MIRASIELEADLFCAGDGLVVGAAGITIDLGGHQIAGDGDGVGIRNDGFDGVVVTDGRISGFDRGIQIVDVVGNSIEKLEFDSNPTVDIFVDGARSLTIDDNELSPDAIGILALDTDDSVIEDNEIVGGEGAVGVKGEGNLIADNDVERYRSGIWIQAVDGVGSGNRLDGNDIEGSQATASRSTARARSSPTTTPTTTRAGASMQT